MILTIGMGVDSSVLIFERIREEFGRPSRARAAVRAGFATTLTVGLLANVFAAVRLRAPLS